MSLKSQITKLNESKETSEFELIEKHKSEMSTLEVKAKNVIQNKDSVISKLQDELDERLIQCKKYKELLDAERQKQYMI